MKDPICTLPKSSSSSVPRVYHVFARGWPEIRSESWIVESPIRETRVSNHASFRAAEYVRMSTEHQQYSIENQRAAIGRYASARAMQIVRSFADAGKSGLTLAGRDALKELVEVVQTGQADFDHILVYDVSRWGRFQDTDESAFYEFTCRRAGITVHYCSEPFPNDHSVPSNLLKAIKRTMAGEYSRALSGHVFAAQCRLVRLGYWQGGPPGLGLRRQLIDSNGNPKMILSNGERKSLHTDRVILIPGPPDEVATVRKIFRLFTSGKWRAADIARMLNEEGVKRARGGRWTSSDLIINVLSHPKYIGVNLYNRRSFKLQEQRVRNPPKDWVLRTRAFQPIISEAQFHRAQEILAERRKHLTNDEMLDGLRRLLAREGVITGPLIDRSPDLLTTGAYVARFGSLGRAWKLIGYSPPRDFSYVDAKRFIHKLHRKELENIVAQLRSAGVEVEEPSTGFILINREFTASFKLIRCVKQYSFRWLLDLKSSPAPDVFILGRMNSTNRCIMDYFLLSSLQLPGPDLRLNLENPCDLNVYRFNDLSAFFKTARRTGIAEAA